MAFRSKRFRLSLKVPFNGRHFRGKVKKKTKASSFLTVPNNYTSSNYQVSIASILKQVESKLFLATLPYSRIQDGLTLLVGNVSVCGIKLLLSLLNSLFH